MKRLICNLKMNHNLDEMLRYKKEIEKSGCFSFLLCPATLFLPLMHSKKYELCAQNISSEEDELKTGSISPAALKSLDVHSVLIGHAETGDSMDEKILKVSNAVKNKMHCYVILSETKEENDYQYTSFTLLGQIRKILESTSQKDYSFLSFIYEPSWLIGSEYAMDASVVSRIFFHIKEDLRKEFHFDFLFFYGGGLNKNNVKQFLKYDSIDGLLLGSYSFLPSHVTQLLKNDCFSTNVDTTRHK